LAQGALAQLVSGPTTACLASVVQTNHYTYFYNGSCPYVRWQVTGGTVISETPTQVTVEWTTAGANRSVRYQGENRGEGCLETLFVYVIKYTNDIVL
jgi:hypothetical protein